MSSQLEVVTAGTRQLTNLWGMLSTHLQTRTPAVRHCLRYVMTAWLIYMMASASVYCVSHVHACLLKLACHRLCRLDCRGTNFQGCSGSTISHSARATYCCARAGDRCTHGRCGAEAVRAAGRLLGAGGGQQCSRRQSRQPRGMRQGLTSRVVKEQCSGSHLRFA